MPFVRFSRDRRGYEHTYLIHAAPRRGAPTRILYWHRTPPGVKVGRPAFDPEVQRLLERHYPSVGFDWPALLETPMPPPAEAENWRERRRAERSARQVRVTESAGAEPPPAPIEVVESKAAAPAAVVDLQPDADVDRPNESDQAGAETGDRGSRRRRRGGRRRRRPTDPSASNAPGDATPGVEDVAAAPTDQTRSAYAPMPASEPERPAESATEEPSGGKPDPEEWDDRKESLA